MIYGAYSLPFLKIKNLPLVGGNHENQDLAFAIQYEFLRNGFELTESAVMLMSSTSEEELTILYNEMVSVFETLTNGEAYQTYYPNFPNIPERHQYHGLVTRMESLATKVVQERKRLQAIPSLDLVDVDVCSPKKLEELFLNVLYANQSASKLDLELITYGIDQKFEFDFNKVVFKEIQALVGKTFFEKGLIPTRNATTILRIYSAWCGGDPGLKENTKFVKPSAEVRDAFRYALNRSYNIEESFKMYRERWKRVLFYLRPGVHKDRFKRLYEYAFLLRNNPKRLRTFNSYVEEYIKTANKEIFTLLKNRKGVFARRLNQLIDVFGIQAFREFMKFDHDVKRLVELYNYFEGRRTSQERSSVLASQSSSQMVSYGALKALPAKLVDGIQEQLLASVPKKIQEPIWIDPKLYYRPLTTNNRAVDVSLNATVTGQCFQLNQNFIRSFVHWEGRGVDIDFSAFLYKNGQTRKVGWNGSHHESGIVYSGDNTGNSHKNAEYLDIDLALLGKSWDWVVFDAVVYSRIDFDLISDCKSGYCESTARFGKRFTRTTIRESQTIKVDAQQAWLSAIHIPSRTYITMNFTNSDSNITNNADAVIGWLEKNLNPQTEEISWAKLNQGHILHLLAEKVVSDPELASLHFTEETTSEEVASLI